ncbi:zf-HC2 domain-containing protein [Amycolatopsis rhizosphaerae]|uniref:Zf-HC2 domain-containing protein n=1 Tax=Amycolatopsis rhizosphaerae TaxID=2053003 RepID=A0A558API9_9PSEU|nr:zf-HC2 domain-containing protein [Amycolatopsis rhizosphaerae]TVT26173.1 zf-HC2 domain-containing protein [Amycolatopsis rhizosphaerae]
MTGRADPFRTYDAAYVLGALSPADRAAFEEHLDGCADCARSVRELAGLPGLLAQVTPEPVGEQPPAGLLPSVLRRVRRLRLRRTLVTGGVGLVAAAVVLVAILLPPGDGGSSGAAMTPLGAFPVQATAAVAAVSGGSRVDLSCQYHGAGRGADYLLVAVRRDGTEAQLATWWADPERIAKLSLDTALPADDIQALEIRTRSGLPLLRWHP